ncbi:MULTISPECIES: molybdopterin-guanine dinucleotide biosynthesis protein B [unclassified Helicobacter]|uniref:molybdopterin-guanine dinucleotide biosynthesis protein B n=1 Tax=unclassified Helicobacter TaxID=2593540 RepID=UPI000CF06688|nr:MULTISPECIES: molybdopterin-guanine dinucleotide biosynthesis protein B [unclassified Helicobacter]
MAKIVGFGGVSNSGKTTLIEKILLLFHHQYSFLVIKHDPKNKANFDTQGKDSQRFFQAGADVVLSSEVKSAIFLHARQDIKQVCLNFCFKDFILIEGYKELDIPRICVARNDIFMEELENSSALAIDDSLVNKKIDFKGERLNLNLPEKIFEWIQENAKTPKELGWN